MIIRSENKQVSILTFLTSRLAMTGPLLLLETEIVFSLEYMSVFITKLVSAPATELKKYILSKRNIRHILTAKDKTFNFLLGNFILKLILTWAGNAVIPVPGWQDTGVTPKSLHLFVYSNSNNILCSHPRLPANLPSQFRLEENKTNFKHKSPYNSGLHISSKATIT